MRVKSGDIVRIKETAFPDVMQQYLQSGRGKTVRVQEQYEDEPSWWWVADSHNRRFLVMETEIEPVDSPS